MTKSEIILEVRFYYSSKEFMIRFPDTDTASSYLNKNQHASVKDHHKVYHVFLSVPGGLDYIRTSNDTSNIVFAFKEGAAAKSWCGDMIIGKHEDKEVRINLKWDKKELDKRIGNAPDSSAGVGKSTTSALGDSGRYRGTRELGASSGSP
jgi:hypothetical protein